MANQIISTDSNHDNMTSRAAGEDFTIQDGATLTIDSMPHLTSMGILGDITMSGGSLLIDGSRTFEVAYSSGSGTLPAVGDAITWNAGADAGKVVRLNSGDNTSGVLTLTVDVGDTTPDDADSITDGAWTADLDSVKVGFLIVYGEDQDWGSVDGRSSLRITGDWYEIGTGTGANGQTVTLPHTGHQPAIWVETGSGTGVFEIWCRVNTTASAVFFDSLSAWGSTFESGYVYDQQFGSATVTFGTSTNGGAPPSGARIRIPNVHIGTTTVGAPTTEVNSATFLSHIGIVPPNTNLNVEIDHLNGSSCYVDFRGTNAVVVSDSCWGLSTSSSFVQKVNATVELTNCAIVNGSHGLAGGYQPLVILGVVDNIGGITITDCVFHHGTNSNNSGAFVLTTMANLDFVGRCKLSLAVQDENTTYALRATTASNITSETLICLGGSLGFVTSSNGIDIGELIYGLPPGRGTTEETMNGALVHTASKGCIIRSGGFASGGAKHGRNYIFILTDSDDVTIRNFGSPDAKIDGEVRATGVANFLGITSNILMQRVWYTNLNGAMPYSFINSAADITLENCSGDYNDEIETDATRVLVKGMHGASGGLDSATGVEGDVINVLATCFLDYFKSDTTGALGLTFNDRGNKHLPDITITAGTPIWNGLGDLLMRTTGDQVVYEWPYQIKGHTAFQNAAIQVSVTGSYTYEYDLDTGGGFSGSWTTINGANLSAETISPAGFRFKVRITATATNASAAIKGLAVLTNTTLAAQAANFYPLDINTVTFNGLPTGCDVVVLVAGTDTILEQKDAWASSSYGFTYSGAQTIDIGFLKPGYIPYYIRGLALGTTDSSIPVSLTADRNYS